MRILSSSNRINSHRLINFLLIFWISFDDIQNPGMNAEPIEPRGNENPKTNTIRAERDFLFEHRDVLLLSLRAARKQRIIINHVEFSYHLFILIFLKGSPRIVPPFQYIHVLARTSIVLFHKFRTLSVLFGMHSLLAFANPLTRLTPVYTFRAAPRGNVANNFRSTLWTNWNYVSTIWIFVRALLI